MQIPLAQVMDAVTGTGGMLQKLVGSAGGSADFEADLKTALTSDGGPAATLVGKILKKLGATGASDQSAAEQALASGAVALQSLIILNQAGLSAADIQQLLGGEGAQVSDSGLETLLVNLGYDAEQVSAVMADSSAKAKLVEALGASLNDLIEQFCSAGGESAESLKLELAASLDQIAALPADLKSALAAQTPESKTAIAEQLGRLAEAVRAALDEKPSGEPVISAFKPLVSAPASAPDSPVAPAQVVAPAIASGQAIGVVNNRAAAAKAEKLVETATNEIGVAAEDLAEVLVSSAPEDRAAAVSAVTSQVRSYFENHQDEKLSPKVRDSLELIRSGMSENEFAPIDEALQAFSGIHLKEVATPLNSQVLQAAAQQLAPQHDLEQQFAGVLDQLKQSFATELKNPPSSVSLELNPPMLGRLDVSVSLLDGNLSASFKADQIVTRDMLVNNLENLKETLREQGFNVNQVNVSLDFGRERRDDLAFAFAQQQQRRDGQTSAAREGRQAARIKAAEALESYPVNPSVSYAPGQLSLFA